MIIYYYSRDFGFGKQSLESTMNLGNFLKVKLFFNFDMSVKIYKLERILMTEGYLKSASNFKDFS